MRLFTGPPERIETAVVKFTMDGEAYDRLQNFINDSGIKISTKVEKYDTVELSFEFTIEYYNIVAQLRSLIILLNDPSVSSAMIGSRDSLNLLFVDLIDTIRNVQKALEEKVSQ